MAGLTGPAAGSAAEPTAAQVALEHVMRDSYGRMLAALAVVARDIALAEECLQDAFDRALRTWTAAGIPSSPAGWLVAAARRSMLDRLRSAEYRNASPDAGVGGGPDWEPSTAEPATGESDGIPDRRLALMFVCAHPAIDAAARTPLMLQTVLGVDTERIARAFAVPVSEMSQRLARSKRRIKETGIPFSEPALDALADRLPSLLEAIHGAYSIDRAPASRPAGHDRPDGEGLGVATPDAPTLSAEALALAEIAAQLMPREPEALGLAALICLSMGREGARVDDPGLAVPADNQEDAGRSGAALIARGEAHLRDARMLTVDDRGAPRAAGRFQLEATIRSAHGDADDDRARNGRVDRGVLLGPDAALAPTLADRTSLEVLGVALARTVAELEESEAGITAKVPDALHRARTRVRMLRSILSVYRGVFDAGDARLAKRALRRHAAVLGAARDAEVRAAGLRERRDSCADDELRAALEGPVAKSERDAEKTRARVLEYLGSQGHADASRFLHAFGGHPRPGPDGAAPAPEVVLPRLARSAARVAARRTAAHDLGALHALRKAARRLRYAAEAAGACGDLPTATWSQPLAALASAAEAVQDVLGADRDKRLLALQLDDWSGRSTGVAAKRLAELARDIRLEAERGLVKLDKHLDAVSRAARPTAR